MMGGGEIRCRGIRMDPKKRPLAPVSISKAHLDIPQAPLDTSARIPAAAEDVPQVSGDFVRGDPVLRFLAEVEARLRHGVADQLAALPSLFREALAAANVATRNDIERIENRLAQVWKATQDLDKERAWLIAKVKSLRVERDELRKQLAARSQNGPLPG